MTLELIDTDKWCARVHGAAATKVLIDDDGTILGWYCDPCGATELAAVKERRKPPARCTFQRNSNRQCMLEPDHGCDHHLPCVESSAHAPHLMGGMNAAGHLYACRGHHFDRT